MNENKSINTKAEKVGMLLRKLKISLSCAESCTGGLLSHIITNIPGSSEYFLLGVVAYSNESKINLLQVSPKTIKEHGAVSSQCANEMLKGIRNKINSKIAVSITGIAGPDSPSSEKPVGLVYIGISDVNGKTQIIEENFKGTRIQIKHKIVEQTLNNLISYLENVKK